MEEFDLFARDAPPPRHQVESDSEESDSEEAQYARPRPTLPAADLRWRDAPRSIQGKTVVVLEGPAGESYLTGLDSSAPLKPDVTGTAEAGVGHVPQALVAVVEDTVYVFIRTSPSVSTLPEAAIGLAHVLVRTLQPRSLILLTSYNAGTYIHPWTNAGDEKEPEGSRVRYIAHGYPDAALTALDGVAGMTVPNYLTGLGAALIGASLEAGAEQVLAILAPFLEPQLHGFYQGSNLDKADAQWATSRPRTPPPFGPEHQHAIASALQVGSPHSAVRFASFAQWIRQEWAQVAAGPPSSSMAHHASRRALGDGNLYL